MLALAIAAVGFAVTSCVVAVALLRAASAGGGRRLSTVTGAQVGPGDVLAPELILRGDRLPWLGQRLSGTQLQRRLQAETIRAGLLLRPEELLALSGLGALVGGTAGLLLGGLLGAVAGALLLGLAPWAYVKVLQSRRKRRLMMQLPDALDLICASLRTGYGFVQSLNTVAEQIGPPIRDEARRVVEEVSLGLALDASLQRMVERTAQPDIELLCAAVQVQHRTGGNLAEVLGNISGVIRGRIQLAGEIDALTAEGRLSALILLALPFGMAALLSYMSPGWLRPLVVEAFGRLILGGGIVAMLVGLLWMKRQLTVDV